MQQHIQQMEKEATEVERFWQELVPTQQGEKACLHRHGHIEGHTMSYKDFYAHAHCAAAYLMQQGLSHGDPVVILSGNTADYLILDLALQYLGAINITLPADIAPDDLERIGTRYEARFIYMPDAETLTRHGGLERLKPSLSAILVGTDQLEGLDTHKLIAFDRLVAIGKIAWREHAPLLRERKQRVRGSDLYALVVPEEGVRGDFEPFSFISLMEAVRDSSQVFKAKGEGALLSLLQPSRALYRTFGSYAAMLARTPVWIYPLEAVDAAFLARVRPDVITCAPEDVLQLYQNLPACMGKDPNAVKAAKKAIQKAHDVLKKKVDAESAGKPNPFLNRLRYRFSSRKTYAKARVGLGGRLATIVSDHGAIDREASVFLQECGIRIEQPRILL